MGQPMNVLDSVLGPGVVTWDPLVHDDPTGMPYASTTQWTRTLDSEHMQQHGISQVHGLMRQHLVPY